MCSTTDAVPLYWDAVSMPVPVYESEPETIVRCKSCGTVYSMSSAIDKGTCERCGHPFPKLPGELDESPEENNMNEDDYDEDEDDYENMPPWWYPNGVMLACLIVIIVISALLK